MRLLRPLSGAVAGLLLCGAAGAAPASVSLTELAHCAAIIPVDQRLACYDSLALAKLPPPKPASAATVAGGAAAAAGTVTAPVAPDAVGSFGMSTHAPPSEVSTESITARVVSGSVDRQGNVLVKLDNGQTWTYIDQYGPPQTGSEVTIRRASLGSYLLTTPSHRSYRAQRTS